jgi:hypothetical protein
VVAVVECVSAEGTSVQDRTTSCSDVAVGRCWGGSSAQWPVNGAEMWQALRLQLPTLQTTGCSVSSPTAIDTIS